MAIKLTPEEKEWPIVRKDPDQAGGCHCAPDQLVYSFQVVADVSVAAKDIHQALREIEQVRRAGRIIIGDAKLHFSASDIAVPLSVNVYDPNNDEVVERP